MERGLAAAVAAATFALLGPAAARAQPLDDFQEARAAFAEGRYEDAAAGFRELVRSLDPRGEDAGLHHEARKYLGIAYLYLHREDDARREVRAYLRYILPRIEGFRLDPVIWPEQVVTFFDDVKSELEAERRAAEAAAEALARAEARQRETATAAYIAELEAQAGRERVREEHSRALATVPFGVGQFQNGHDGLGWTLLVSEVLLLGTSVVSGALWWNLDPEQARADGVIPASFERAETAYAVTNFVSTGLLGLLVIVGIVDAQLRFVPERVRFEPRALPPDPRDAGGGEEEATAPRLRLRAGGLELAF